MQTKTSFERYLPLPSFLFCNQGSSSVTFAGWPGFQTKFCRPLLAISSQSVDRVRADGLKLKSWESERKLEDQLCTEGKLSKSSSKRTYLLLLSINETKRLCVWSFCKNTWDEKRRICIRIRVTSSHWRKTTYHTKYFYISTQPDMSICTFQNKKLCSDTKDTKMFRLSNYQNKNLCLDTNFQTKQCF